MRYDAGMSSGLRLRRDGCSHPIVPPNENEKKRSPEAALDELMAGNRRFTSGRTSSHRRDLAFLQQMMERPEPFAAILSCADSRVPVEVVFDQTIGQLFVTRVAGNIVTTEIVASLEYAAAVLGTNTILVMGHSRCGAVTAAIQASFRVRRFRGKSVRFSPISSLQWSKPAPIWRPLSAPMC